MPARSILSVCLALSTLAPTAATAQTLNMSFTDPEAIAAECGGEAAAGQPIFEALCADCHSLEADGDQSRGPHLDELYGRAAGGLEDYPYRSALPQTTIIWEGDSLRAFLAGDLPGIRHPTVPDDQTRRDLLTYVRIHTHPAPPAADDVTVPADVLAMEGDRAYGEYLASDCLSCHNRAAEDTGMATIYGRVRSEFLTLMYQYQARAIGSDTMQLYAANLSGEEMAALAAYFETATP